MIPINSSGHSNARASTTPPLHLPPLTPFDDYNNISQQRMRFLPKEINFEEWEPSMTAEGGGGEKGKEDEREGGKW